MAPPWRFFGRRWTQIRNSQEGSPDEGRSDDERDIEEESHDSGVPPHGESGERAQGEDEDGLEESEEGETVFEIPAALRDDIVRAVAALQIERVIVEEQEEARRGATSRWGRMRNLQCPFDLNLVSGSDDARPPALLLVVGCLLPPFPWILGMKVLTMLLN